MLCMPLSVWPAGQTENRKRQVWGCFSRSSAKSPRPLPTWPLLCSGPDPACCGWKEVSSGSEEAEADNPLESIS